MAKFLFWIAVATVASATTMGQNLKLIPGQSEMLLPRDFGAGICVIGSTCDECFGEGYRICDKIGCFNPDKHQQCCKDAVLCVAKTDDCCKDHDGKGVEGPSGAPIAPTTTTTASGAQWTCSKEDSGEDCCHRGGPDIHYCGGAFPSQRCLNATNQWCCSDGVVCEEENCCQHLFNLPTAQPWKKDDKTPSPQTTSPPDATESTIPSGETATSTSSGSLVTVATGIVGVLLIFGAAVLL